MKATFLTIIAVLFALSLPIQARAQCVSGITVNAGSGSVSTDLFGFQPSGFYHTEYKYNLSVGYRFRLPPITRYSLYLDIDANLGVKDWDARFSTAFKENSQYYFISAGTTLNCPIYKGLSVGAGFEPVYYLSKQGEDSNKNLDIPVVVKIAYNFKFFEAGVSYKHVLINGLMDSNKKRFVNSVTFNDWQLSLWIPLATHR